MKNITKILILITVTILTLCFASCEKKPLGQLDAPQKLVIKDEILSWDPVPNASKYIITVDGKQYEVWENALDIFEIAIVPDKTYGFSVIAVQEDGSYTDSVPSTTVTYQFPSCLGWEMREINDGAAYEIVVTKEKVISGKFVIPDTYNGKPVTKIADNGFLNCTNLTALYISNSITEIGDFSFKNCTKLSRIHWSDQIVSIGDYSFLNCENLQKIELPPSLARIGNCAFANCKAITALHIPASVIEIGGGIIGGCIKLAAPTIDPGNTEFQIVNDCLLSKDYRLIATWQSSVSLPNGIVEIGTNVFANSTIEEIEIPPSVKIIGEKAFENCKQLKSIKFNEGLEKICSSAFFCCINLEKLNLPATLTEIQPDSIQKCASLRELTVAKENAVYASAQNCILKKEDLQTLYMGCVGTQIPSDIKVIGEKAFYYCPASEILLPEGLTEIKAQAFYQAALKKLSLPQSLKVVGKEAFYGCTYITDLIIPKQMETIETRAFATGGVMTVILPSTVTTVNADAFTGVAGIVNGCIIFTDYVDMPSNWINEAREKWYGGATVLLKCTFGYDDDIPYVKSFASHSGICLRGGYSNEYWGVFQIPKREGYTFFGWSSSEGGAAVALLQSTTHSIPKPLSVADEGEVYQYTVTRSIDNTEIAIIAEAAYPAIYAVWIKS